MSEEIHSAKYDAGMKLASRLEDQDNTAVAAALDVLQTADALRMSLHERFFRGNISEGRFTVLTLLLTAKDWCLTPSQLASASGVTRATMTGLIDGLEKEEFVERRASRSDRRKITVRLTSSGRELLLDLAPGYFEILANAGQCLANGKQKNLSSLLGKLREAAS